MIDPETKAAIDAEEAQAFEDKTQAEYEAKPACEKCGHHPGDALHDCRPKADAPPRDVEPAHEVEAMDAPDVLFFLRMAEKHMPDSTPGDKIMWARKMVRRHPLIDAAYKAGLRNGRDFRERATRGLGWWDESMTPLTPRERTFVMEKLREAILESRA